ncbi:phage tail tape measure protein [Sesbania bispinosa]|nr:phage tail tape measure protein [Sesbania bispinosa]
MEQFNPSIPKYSSKLGVGPAKPIINIMKEQGMWTQPSGSSMEEEKNFQNQKEDKEPKSPEANTDKNQVGP